PKNPTTITAPLEALQKQEPWPDWQSKLSSTKHALEFSNHHHTGKKHNPRRRSTAVPGNE
ncbi:hypothetical protein, partial [Bifidobacterium callimiconis]|uniref:hypothetical protein n=1 Tax=Bifidobacterium callimiconis TaxID=2306973 RepID=UPI0019D1F0CA